MRRHIKQFIYGIFYLAFFAVIGFGFYFSNKPAPTCFDNRQNQKETGIDCGGECPSCEIKHLAPLVASPVTLFANEGKTSALFEVRNTNQRYGAQQFPYTLTLFDNSNRAIFIATTTSFIYPTEIKYIVNVGLDLGGDVPVRGEVVLGPTAWKTAPDFFIPRLETRSLKAEFNSQNHRVIISGLLLNNNSFQISSAKIVGILTLGGVFAGVSQTVLNDLPSLGERPFTISVPVEGNVPQINLDNVKIYVETVR